MISSRQLSALLKRYYICYFRIPGHFGQDFTYAIIIGASLGLGSFYSSGTILFLIVYFAMIPFTFMSVLRSTLGEIVSEKSTKIKEYLKLNGVTNLTYQAYCFIVTTVKMGIFCLFILAGVGVGYVFSQTSSVISQLGQSYMDLFILYVLTSIATISFILFFSTLFSEPKFASDFGGFFYVLVSLASFTTLLSKSQTPYLLMCLFPQSALTLGIIASITEHGTNPYLPIRLNQIFMMLGIDTIIYLIAYTYLDQVISDGNGVKKSWFFFLNCKKRRAIPEDRVNLLDGAQTDEDTSSAIYHEQFSNLQNAKKNVQIIQLSKSFGHLQAVDNISLSIYERQILCLLGHNGAGKTTTINMLTGLIQPDNGDVLYDGVSFFDDLERARSKIGLCCQQDILFPRLKVYEHLELIGRLRGIPEAQLQEAVKQAAEKMNLMTEIEKFSEHLSGGNKRKLSLAMAVLGNTKVIFLDEPTAGMDPQNRRVIWHHIKDLKFNHGLTILMTTHHLDEADELADRIAIMSKGRLLALGTSEFMKKKFGVGYYLSITPNYQLAKQGEFVSLIPTIDKIVSHSIEGSKREEQTSADVVKYLLPFTAQPKFPELFVQLEQIPQIKISMQMNSLEDTYVNIGLKEDELFGGGNSQEIINMDVNPPQCISRSPTYSFWNQTFVIFTRKYYVTTRSWRDMILIFLPALIIIGGSLVQTTINEATLKLTFFSFFLTVSYALNTASYCAFPVYEREENLKYAMDVMGLRPLPYWLGTLLFDTIATSLINLIQFACYSIIYDAFTGSKTILSFFITPNQLLIVSFPFALSIVCCAYVWSFFFKKSLTAVKAYPVFYYFVLYTLPNLIVGMIYLNTIQNPDSSTLQVLVYITYIICPSNLLSGALMPTNKVSIGGLPTFIGNWQTYSVWMLGTGILYFIIAIILESRRTAFKRDSGYQQQGPPEHLPIDFNEINFEAQRTINTPTDPIRVLNLQKSYGYFNAVKGISFGVQPGQIFGLLGPNGAGKSTTFNILTALIPKTAGSAQLLGQEVDRNMPELYQNVGICPQVNCLWERLTVREHMILFGGLKGLSGVELDETIEYYLDVLSLREHAHKRAMNLSGGNKRKLCVANCLIGSPKLLFFDEPSTGLDPLAKRFLWNSLQQILRARNASIILTTHSMNEAESLAHKTGILINGRFFCIGSTEMLKDKYGSGYKMTILLHDGQESMENVMKQLFPACRKIYDGSTTQETYEIASAGFKFSDAFAKLGELHLAKKIKDFSIYNTTLEQVFIYFSRFQIVNPHVTS